jgi:hypothetical protein
VEHAVAALLLRLQQRMRPRGILSVETAVGANRCPKGAQNDGMKMLPQNIVPFVLRGLPPLDKLDQRLMRKLRKLADRTGSTVEDLIHEGILEFVAKHEAEKELETKIIRFPTPMREAYRAKVK